MIALPAGIHRIDVPVPRPGGLITGTNCYVIEDADGGVHLVDPGWADDGSRAALEAELAALGHALADLRSLIVTHAHVDHLGLAHALQADGFGRLVLARAEVPALESWSQISADDDTLDRWGVPADERAELPHPADRRPHDPITPDVLLDDGERLDIPGFDIRVLVTPGHTAGSLCLLVDDRLALTGDTVLPGINPGLGLGGFPPDDDPIGAALASLDRLTALGELDVAPGHGAPFPGLATRSAELATRHRARSAEIASLLDDPDASIWSIASRVGWTGGWEAVRGFLRVSALAQTELHVRHLARTAA